MKGYQNSTLIFIASIKLYLTTVNDAPEKSWVSLIIYSWDREQNPERNMGVVVGGFCSHPCYSRYCLFDPGWVLWQFPYLYIWNNNILRNERSNMREQQNTKHFVIIITI